MLAGLADDGFAAAVHVTFSGRWHDFFSACGVIGRVREGRAPFLSGDPQPEQGLTPIVALSVVQIERGDWSAGAGRRFVDRGAGIGGELSTGSAYEEPVQGGTLVCRQGA